MTYAYGVLDTFYRYDMTLDEAVELGNFIINFQAEEQFITQQIEILLLEVMLEFIMFIREDGLKKLLVMMLMFFITNTENKKVLKKINKEENFD